MDQPTLVSVAGRQCHCSSVWIVVCVVAAPEYGTGCWYLSAYDQGVMMDKYLIEYYKDVEDGYENAVERTVVVGDVDIWTHIDQAKQDGHRIVVYKVGRQLLDWSEPSND